MDRDMLVHVYFRLGLSYEDILCILAHNHGIVLSLRTLKRILRAHGLYRRKFKSDILQVALFISDTVEQHGSYHGYRWMHSRCIHDGLVVDRETVRILLQIIDSEGVMARSRRRLQRRSYFAKGPNYIWHMDSYDKLKPYGICINGCIDGFSRAIIWLKANTTSSNPRVVASYYMEEVRIRMACPKLIRGDLGTENGKVAEFQNFMTDTESFLYGTSQHNQRIERWWGILRKEFAQFWMNLFGAMRDEGLYCGDFVEQNLLQFCFMKLIQVSKCRLSSRSQS